MAALVIGVLHPGEMGSALGAGLRGGGHDVVWASEGRSAATAARAAAAAFAGRPLGGPVISARIGDASAVKMAYAAWTKGQAALLLTARAIARAEGVEAALMGEWARSQPGLADACAQAARSAAAKG